MARGPKAVVIKELKTLNPNLTYFLEEVDGSYCIYFVSFEERIDLIMYNEDLELMTKIMNFYVSSYDEGFVDGKNSALMFFNN